MGQNFTTNIEPVLRPLLADGERLIVASPMMQDIGTTEDLTIGDQLKALLDPTRLFGLTADFNGPLQRAILGRAVSGPEGSIGRRLYEAVGATKSVPDLALTDSRLLVFWTEVVNLTEGNTVSERWFGPTDMVAHLAHEVPRDWIVGAVRAPKGLLRRGRFFVTFVDGSGCALVGSRRAGREAVAELGPPQLQARATGEEHA